MFLPLSDSPNPGGRPYVTYALIAANVLVYLVISLPLSFQPPDPNDPALSTYLLFLRNMLPPGVSIYEVLQQISAYNIFVFAHGYKPGAPHAIDLLTSLFLHSGLMHLVGNMLFLWIYGDNVEYKLGRVAFLLWYLGTGVLATLFFSFFAQGSWVPLVGASGAISGVLGFYFLWFPRNKVRLFVWLFPFYVGTVSVPARIVLGLFLVVDNLFPFLLDSAAGTSGVAYGAHIGGFFAGLAGAFLIERTQPSTDGLDLPEVEDGYTSKPGIREALADGDLARAAHEYFALPAEATRAAVDAATSLELADSLARFDYPDAALTVYRRHLRDFPSDPTSAAAHVGLGLIQLDRLGQVAPAYQHFLEALDRSPDAPTAARARDALDRIAALQKLNVGRPTR